MEPTGKEAVAFLTFASSRGLMNANTAGSLRAAVKEVLQSVEPDGWEATDLTKIDLADYCQRFERLSAGRYKPDSVLVYKSRFRNAVAMFLQYLEDPSAWRYKPDRPSASRPKPPANGSPRGGRHAPLAHAVGADEAPKAATITYPFPVRQGVVASLVLPADLTKPEAKRLAAFIDSVAVEQTLLLHAPAGAREAVAVAGETTSER